MTDNNTDKKQILKLTGDLGELKGKITALDSKVSDGFKRIEDRLEQVFNHQSTKLKEMDKREDKLAESIANIKGRAAGIAFIIALITTVIGLLIAYLR